MYTKLLQKGGQAHSKKVAPNTEGSAQTKEYTLELGNDSRWPNQGSINLSRNVQVDKGGEEPKLLNGERGDRQQGEEIPEGS